MTTAALLVIHDATSLCVQHVLILFLSLGIIVALFVGQNNKLGLSCAKLRLSLAGS